MSSAASAPDLASDVLASTIWQTCCGPSGSPQGRAESGRGQPIGARPSSPGALHPEEVPKASLGMALKDDIVGGANEEGAVGEGRGAESTLKKAACLQDDAAPPSLVISSTPIGKKRLFEGGPAVGEGDRVAPSFGPATTALGAGSEDVDLGASSAGRPGALGAIFGAGGAEFRDMPTPLSSSDSLSGAIRHPDSPAFDSAGGRGPGCAFRGYFVTCLAATCTASCLAVVLWSYMGCGRTCLAGLQSQQRHSLTSAGVLLLILVVLYMLDFFNPPHLPKRKLVLYDGDVFVGRAMLFVAVLLMIASMFFAAKEFPTAPLALTIFLCPIGILAVRHITMPAEKYKHHPRGSPEALGEMDFRARIALLRRLTGEEKNQRDFYSAAMYAFIATGLVVLCCFIPWAIVSEDDFAEKMETQIADKTIDSELVFILWAAPMIVAFSNFIFASFAGLRLALNEAYTATDQIKNQLIVGQQSSILNDELMNHRMTMLMQCFESTEHEHMQSPKRMMAMKVAQDRMQRYLVQHISHMRQLSNIVKTVGCAFIVMLGALYIAFQLTAADSHVAQMVQGFFGALFLTFVFFIYVSFHRLWHTMHSWLQDLPLWSSARSAASSSFARAVCLVLVLPLLPFLLGLSALNQSVRRLRGLSQAPVGSEGAALASESTASVSASASGAPEECSLEGRLPLAAGAPEALTSPGAAAPWSHASLPPAAPFVGDSAASSSSVPAGGATAVRGGAGSGGSGTVGAPAGDLLLRKARRLGCFTRRVQAHLDAAREWKWVEVVWWSYAVSFAFILWKVLPLLLNVLLAWMSSLIGDLHFGVILISTYVAGMALFMLPPVPGPPIYLFGGFVISDKCPWGFWWGAAICVILCFVLKLSACAIQQKLIGQRLGNNQWVRQTVGVHKPFIRAIEAVLRQRGLDFGKCMILCGGPDWPTSVLAGILRLSLFQCELGTFPIIFNVIPLTLTGSFYLKRDDSEVWLRAGNLMFTLTVLASVVFWAGMGWAIQNEFEKNHEALSKPQEEFVDLDWRDHRAEVIASRCVLSWTDLPRWLRVAFVLGALGLMGIAHAFMWRFQKFFGTFAVTDDISELEWFGADGIVKPAGVGLLFAASVCCLGMVLFSVWANRRRRAPAARAAKELDGQEEAWKAARLEEARRAALGGARATTATAASPSPSPVAASTVPLPSMPGRKAEEWLKNALPDAASGMGQGAPVTLAAAPALDPGRI